MSRAGIYIHIPFCRTRCSYCDFATGQYESGLSERYVRALAREISDFAAKSARAGDGREHTNDPRDHESGARGVVPNGDETFRADTVYFGGGTPSLLTPA
ncbi:MAG: hypothetical protein ABR554_16070, partial [Pyrinomonadaceae bacterium]